LKKKKLHLGCGKIIKEGYVNLDIQKLPGVDVIHDLNKFPYPFKDNSFQNLKTRCFNKNYDPLFCPCFGISVESYQIF